jgi:hypothetical protein
MRYHCVIALALWAIALFACSSESQGLSVRNASSAGHAHQPARCSCVTAAAAIVLDGLKVLRWLTRYVWPVTVSSSSMHAVHEARASHAYTSAAASHHHMLLCCMLKVLLCCMLHVC